MISTEVFLINRAKFPAVSAGEKQRKRETHNTHTHTEINDNKLPIFSSPSDGLWSIDDSDGEGLRSVTIYTFSNSFHYFTVCILVAQLHPTHCDPVY